MLVCYSPPYCTMQSPPHAISILSMQCYRVHPVLQPATCKTVYILSNPVFIPTYLTTHPMLQSTLCLQPALCNNPSYVTVHSVLQPAHVLTYVSYVLVHSVLQPALCKNPSYIYVTVHPVYYLIQCYSPPCVTARHTVYVI